jgi:hypothetical protein
MLFKIYVYFNFPHVILGGGRYLALPTNSHGVTKQKNILSHDKETIGGSWIGN